MVLLYLIKLYHYVGIIYISKYFQYKKPLPEATRRSGNKKILGYILPNETITLLLYFVN